jgi:hypothetical protein
MKTVLLFAFVIIGCTSTHEPDQACLTACDQALIQCETPVHQACANCCEGRDQTLCSDSASSNDPVSTCLSTCETETDNAQCVPTETSCEQACQ